MPLMSPRHFQRRRLEGIGTGVYYQPTGRDRTDKDEEFPVPVFLCSFEHGHSDTDSVLVNDTFKIDTIKAESEIDIDPSDQNFMRNFEGMKCIRVQQHHPSFIRVLDIGVNQYILIDVDGKGFSEHFATRGKMCLVFADPYYPKDYKEKFHYMYTKTPKGEYNWTPAWRDQSDTVRILLMKRNITRTEWKQLIQEKAFELIEHREIAQHYMEGYSKMAAENLWLSSMVESQAQENVLLNIGLTDLSVAHNETYGLLRNRNLSDMADLIHKTTGEISSKYGLHVTAGSRMGELPKISRGDNRPNPLPPGAIEEAKEYLGRLEYTVREMDVFIRYGKNVSHTETMQRNIARKAIKLCTPEIIREELGDSVGGHLVDERLIELANKLQLIGESKQINPKEVVGDIRQLVKGYLEEYGVRDATGRTIPKPPEETLKPQSDTTAIEKV